MRWVGSNSHRPGSTWDPAALAATSQSRGAWMRTTRSGRLEVGLVEAGEYPLGVVEERLAVQVDRVVLRIGEPVQSLARVGVAPSGPVRRACSRRQVGREAAGSRPDGRVDGSAVEAGLDQGGRLELREGPGAAARGSRRWRDGGVVNHAESDRPGQSSSIAYECTSRRADRATDSACVRLGICRAYVAAGWTAPARATRRSERSGWSDEGPAATVWLMRTTPNTLGWWRR